MTVLEKDSHGNWRAEDRIVLDDGRTAELVTHKVYSGSVVTSVQVGRRNGPVFEFTNTDFRTNLKNTVPNRATSKYVAAQHQEVLQGIEQLKLQVAAYYLTHA